MTLLNWMCNINMNMISLVDLPYHRISVSFDADFLEKGSLYTFYIHIQVIGLNDFQLDRFNAKNPYNSLQFLQLKLLFPTFDLQGNLTNCLTPISWQHCHLVGNQTTHPLGVLVSGIVN